MKSVKGPLEFKIGFREIANISLNALLLPHPESLNLQELLPDTLDVPDVSFWQGEIDWDKMATRTRNVIVRAGQGSWPDKYFKVNWIKAKQRAMNRGLYWFYDGNVSPAAQASLLARLIGNDFPELGIWIDWEANYGGAHEGLKNVVALMEVLESKFPDIQIGLYTGYYFFIANSNVVANASQYKYLQKHKLWLAQYGVFTEHLRIPRPFTKASVELHQYGTPTVGYEFGCKSRELDMSHVVIKSNGHDYLRMAGVSMDGWFRVTSETLAVRSVPGSGDAITKLGELTKNNVVRALNVSSIGSLTFYRVSEAYDSDGNLVKLSSGQYVKDRNDCWINGAYLAPADAPKPPEKILPPQSIIVIDKDGITWVCTNFERRT